ncbi:hypothetical protein SKAU_G00310950 [Synaphobranchus kaupii]|uniref:Uncharacterized protein n=1 Tax=Synaphobranchus kaupii TaxID=118154 RepID=A0A9Q1IKA3_SYNKA|nr:hypothetical protein SKAU_G00310950 [Synaphobranchus kaupii]
MEIAGNGGQGQCLDSGPCPHHPSEPLFCGFLGGGAEPVTLPRAPLGSGRLSVAAEGKWPRVGRPGQEEAAACAQAERKHYLLSCQARARCPARGMEERNGRNEEP